MEIIFWMIAIYFVGRRWLKKNPAKAAELKKTWLEMQANKSAPATRETTHTTHTPAPKPVTPFASMKPASAPKAQPVLTQRKKAEKQFQEL